MYHLLTHVSPLLLSSIPFPLYLSNETATSNKDRRSAPECPANTDNNSHASPASTTTERKQRSSLASVTGNHLADQKMSGAPAGRHVYLTSGVKIHCPGPSSTEPTVGPAVRHSRSPAAGGYTAQNRPPPPAISRWLGGTLTDAARVHHVKDMLLFFLCPSERFLWIAA